MSNQDPDNEDIKPILDNERLVREGDDPGDAFDRLEEDVETINDNLSPQQRVEAFNQIYAQGGDDLVTLEGDQLFVRSNVIEAAEQTLVDTELSQAHPEVLEKIPKLAQIAQDGTFGNNTEKQTFIDAFQIAWNLDGVEGINVLSGEINRAMEKQGYKVQVDLENAAITICRDGEDKPVTSFGWT